MVAPVYNAKEFDNALLLDDSKEGSDVRAR